MDATLASTLKQACAVRAEVAAQQPRLKQPLHPLPPQTSELVSASLVVTPPAGKKCLSFSRFPVFPSERRAAWELGQAGDDVIREIKLDATFDKVLQQALLSVGIVKIGLVAEGTVESDDVRASYNTNHSNYTNGMS